MSLWTSDSSWPRLGSFDLRLPLACILLVTVAAGLEAQAPPAEEPLVMEIFSLRYRAAGEAVREIEPLLSARGTVELQPRENTLVVRDTAESLRLLAERLRAYDQPPRRVRLDIQIVRAGAAGQQPSGEPLPAELVRRLRELLRFESFVMLAQAGLEMKEGERVAYQFGADYRVEFELGVLAAGGQLRLQDFMVGRGPESDVQALIHTNLNLTMGRPMVLGLAQTEASERALMVVLTSQLLEATAR